MKKLNNKGFTLVELLAVIVVLALLMVVAASSIGTALDNSKKGALESEGQKLYSNITAEAKGLVIVGTLRSDELQKTYKGIDGDYAYDVELNSSGDITKLIVCYKKDYYVELDTSTKKISKAAAQTSTKKCTTDADGNLTGSVSVS